ncbi:DUF1611 domain-containing protein [Patescibacteria group bacterium]|nr:DUF1611 domain-containing protein [Patescibacteria group bacterium]
MDGHALDNQSFNLKNKKVLIYTGDTFGLEARKKLPSRPKTADGILRYAQYNIVGLVDSHCSKKFTNQILPDLKNKIPIFKTINEAQKKTSAQVLIIGVAPQKGEVPMSFTREIVKALENNLDLVSGLHQPLSSFSSILKAAQKNSRKIWEVRYPPQKLPLASCQTYKIKKPIILTIGTDAALGKLTTTYEMFQKARAKYQAALIPTGQTSVIIEGWGICVDKCAGDFMAGAVEKMILQKEKQENPDLYFVEGQGSLAHPAFSTTAIALMHGACPTHLVLVHRPARKRMTHCSLLPTPSIKKSIEIAEKIILPSYLKSKVVAISLNTQGMNDNEAKEEIKKIKKETNLPTTDQIRFPQNWTELFLKN